MNTISRVASVSLLAFALSAAACSGSQATDQGPQTAQSALTTAPVAQQAHGPVKLFGDALGEVPLRAEQRAELEKLAADVEARHQTTAAAHQDLAQALAAQVEAGAIDRAALQPKIDAAAAAWASVQDADRAALERAHAILDPSQRAKFVDALQARMEQAKGEHHEGHEGMRAWAADLKLTDAQRDQLKQAFHDKMAQNGGPERFRAEMKGHHEQAAKVFEAFKGDRFVMDEVAPKKDPKVMASKMSDRMIGMIETALPILTPEQRTLAASKIRAHAKAPAPMIEHPSF